MFNSFQGETADETRILVEVVQVIEAEAAGKQTTSRDAWRLYAILWVGRVDLETNDVLHKTAGGCWRDLASCHQCFGHMVVSVETPEFGAMSRHTKSMGE
jgi:hypothetical protein